ncbi:hypothetical protein [Nonomuraea dietziae]|uniref:hypothetical protein n=1 Tax=Nonomuraea dietziae TaxID=65515 RepID=UPI003401DD5F
MTTIEWLTTLPDLSPLYWTAAGAAAAVLLRTVFWLVMRMFFPKRREPERPRRSLANAVTWACAAAALVISGEGIFEVIQQAAPDVPWLPWLGVGLLEGPLLAFALRAKEEIAQQRDPAPSIRMTWILAALSSVIAATATFATGNVGVVLLRAVTPIVGAILWHHALRIEQDKTGKPKSESRWKWTPEYIATRLGLVTARASQTADAEVHMRLTKVADAVIRYARAAARNTQRNNRWNSAWYTLRRWRMERVYRAAERDLDLTRNTDRRTLLEQMIESRSDAVLLGLLVGFTRADLGLPEVEHPEQPSAEQSQPQTRVVFHKVVEQAEQPPLMTRVLFHKVVEQAEPNDRNSKEQPKRNSGGTPDQNARNSDRGTDDDRSRDSRNTHGRNTDDTGRNGIDKPTLEQINAAIASYITPTGELPVRPLARKLGVSPSTLSRHADKYRKEHGYPLTPEQWNSRPDSIAAWGTAEQPAHGNTPKPLATANGSAN